MIAIRCFLYRLEIMMDTCHLDLLYRKYGVQDNVYKDLLIEIRRFVKNLLLTRVSTDFQW